jgi:putative colanic acid biosynthesis acetyltransferase WcaF
MADDSVIANDVDCYSVAGVEIGRGAIVSQYSHLCTATHDHRDPTFALLVGSIVIGDGAWVASGAFLGPGVTIGEGAVIGARSVVTAEVRPWTVVAGNPSRVIGDRPRNAASLSIPDGELNSVS